MAYPKHFHSFLHRSFYALGSVIAVLGLGTFFMRRLEGFSAIDAFYFTSMIATGQGPAPSIQPQTPIGKIFTCFLAFVSVGTMLASFGFLFGPFFGQIWRIGVIKLEEEIDHLRKHPKP